MTPQPGAPPQAGPPPGMMPNPAFAQWMQQYQARQAVIAQNEQKQKQFDDAVALIKKDGLHGFRLDIEADSTIAPDEQAEKQARIEFLQQMIPLLENIVPIAQGNQALASLASQVALFAVRGFRVGRPLEEAFEEAFAAIAQMPPNPKFTGQQQGKGANPAGDIAQAQADVHDTDEKSRVQIMAIAQKAQQAAQDSQVRMAQIAAENERSQADRAMKAGELVQRERLENARVSRIAAQSTQGLV